MTPISGSTRLVAVIGHPVRHSLSPVIHNAAFASSGADHRCVAFEVAPGDGAAAVSAMVVLGIDGFAVTMPHKDAVVAAVDELDPAAAALGAVNTVVRRPDGSTFGASTDGLGLVDALVEAGHDPAGRRVAVVGAGGAARSIVDALGRHGAADIVILNRTAERAAEAAALTPVARVGSAIDIAGADIVVNATSVGMGADPADRRALPLDPDLLRAGQVVADIVYHPLTTPLLAVAAERGAAVVDGLGMLVHQAARQQQLWVGAIPEPAVLRAAALAELAGRAAAPGRR